MPCLFLAMSMAHARPACSVKSGVRTAALVELYTSEGCSSCPPADRALNALPGGALVVPLALHVTYWDHIGWRDPFGQERFDLRQRQLLDSQRRRVAYTPQFFVGGRELRGWSANLAGTIRAVNERTAPVTITLATAPSSRGIVLDAAVQPAAGAGHSAGALYVAVTESGLDSQVARGENGGATLHHDAAARLLLGPVALVNGKAHLRQDAALPPGWRRARLQAVAFVQEQDGPAILQALGAGVCTAGGR